MRIRLLNLFSKLKQLLLILFSKYKKQVIIAAVILAVLGLPPLVYIVRLPVLIITDEFFDSLYGTERIKRQQRSASFFLFRRVKQVMIADGASPDIVAAALTGTASRPFCVVFPRRYAAAAVFYHETSPQIPSVVLGGLVPPYDLPSPNGVLCVYGTDRDTDLYRAGGFAGILTNALQSRMAQDEEEAPIRQTVVLWQDHTISEYQRQLFIMGAYDYHPETMVVFINSLDELPDVTELACVVLAGAGTEFIDRILHIPVILFSWLDPALTSREVVIMFDDSPWSQMVAAVRMAAKRQEDGIIPSKTLIISRKLADNGVSRILRKSAGKIINNTSR